ncbi:uncharacterized protein VTP21DRAFT_7590 [Calcarisporiella thermophila]|uniref:uncharacterized protein n=1 Tax=Calcarisporiella thermophila TaxID=911321 RepID=UPI003744A8E3
MSDTRAGYITGIAGEFSTNFWSDDDSGKRALFDRLRCGEQTCEYLKQMLYTRAEIEESYGEQMLKLARIPLAKEEIGSIREGLVTTLNFIESDAKAHIQLAAKLRSALHDPLAAFITELKSQRETQQAQVESSFQLKQLYHTSALKAQETYEKEFNKLKGLKSRQPNSTQDNNMDNEEIDIAEYDTIVADREYSQACKTAQGMTEKWNSDWIRACDKIQKMEETRLERIHNFVWEFANLISALCVTTDETAESVRKALEKCNVHADLNTFILEKGTGMTVPEPIVYKKNEKHDELLSYKRKTIGSRPLSQVVEESINTVSAKKEVTVGPDNENNIPLQTQKRVDPENVPISEAVQNTANALPNVSSKLEGVTSPNQSKMKEPQTLNDTTSGSELDNFMDVESMLSNLLRGNPPRTNSVDIQAPSANRGLTNDAGEKIGFDNLRASKGTGLQEAVGLTPSGTVVAVEYVGPSHETATKQENGSRSLFETGSSDVPAGATRPKLQSSRPGSENYSYEYGNKATSSLRASMPIFGSDEKAVKSPTSARFPEEDVDTGLPNKSQHKKDIFKKKLLNFGRTSNEIAGYSREVKDEGENEKDLPPLPPPLSDNSAAEKLNGHEKGVTGDAKLSGEDGVKQGTASELVSAIPSSVERMSSPQHNLSTYGEPLKSSPASAFEPTTHSNARTSSTPPAESASAAPRPLDVDSNKEEVHTLSPQEDVKTVVLSSPFVPNPSVTPPYTHQQGQRPTFHMVPPNQMGPVMVPPGMGAYPAPGQQHGQPVFYARPPGAPQGYAHPPNTMWVKSQGVPGYPMIATGPHPMGPGMHPSPPPETWHAQSPPFQQSPHGSASSSLKDEAGLSRNSAEHPQQKIQPSGKDGRKSKGVSFFKSMLGVDSGKDKKYKEDEKEKKKKAKEDKTLAKRQQQQQQQQQLSSQQQLHHLQQPLKQPIQPMMGQYSQINKPRRYSMDMTEGVPSLGASASRARNSMHPVEMIMDRPIGSTPQPKTSTPNPERPSPTGTPRSTEGPNIPPKQPSPVQNANADTATPNASPQDGPQTPASSHTNESRGSEQKQVLGYVQALWDYEAAIPVEISFKRGDVLALYEKQPDGWWEGEVVNSPSGTERKRGLFPSNYMRSVLPSASK